MLRLCGRRAELIDRVARECILIRLRLAGTPLRTSRPPRGAVRVPREDVAPTASRRGPRSASSRSAPRGLRPVRRRGRTRSSSRPPPALHYLSLVCSLGLSPRLPFAHSPRASTLLSSLQPCGASRLRTSRTASPRPGSPPPAASGSPRGHVPCLCLIAPENRVHAAGGRITRRCSRLARACSSALRAGKRAPAAERHPLDARFHQRESYRLEQPHFTPPRSPVVAVCHRRPPLARRRHRSRLVVSPARGNRRRLRCSLGRRRSYLPSHSSFRLLAFRTLDARRRCWGYRVRRHHLLSPVVLKVLLRPSNAAAFEEPRGRSSRASARCPHPSHRCGRAATGVFR